MVNKYVSLVMGSLPEGERVNAININNFPQNKLKKYFPNFL
jgi:hypothetical protein